MEKTMTKIKPIAPAPSEISEFDQAQVIERPDGFYWQDGLTEKVYGPFPTLLEAVQDMRGQNDDGYEEGETLEDAEAEIGIADWIDPETGEPAEGVSPHLSDE
jgi:hypothetical protein